MRWLRLWGFAVMVLLRETAGLVCSRQRLLCPVHSNLHTSQQIAPSVAALSVATEICDLPATVGQSDEVRSNHACVAPCIN